MIETAFMYFFERTCDTQFVAFLCAIKCEIYIYKLTCRMLLLGFCLRMNFISINFLPSYYVQNTMRFHTKSLDSPFSIYLQESIMVVELFGLRINVTNRGYRLWVRRYELDALMIKVFYNAEWRIFTMSFWCASIRNGDFRVARN